MRNKKNYILLGLLIIILGVINIGCSSDSLNESNSEISLNRPEVEIQEDILKRSPIGTSMDDVIKVVESNEKWEISWKADDHGYRDSSKKGITVGEKSMCVYMGTHSGAYGFTSHVSVFYGFNDKSELIDVWVRRTTDGY